MEKRIYVGWAFTENEREKAKINNEIHKELREKYKVYRNDANINPDVDLNDYDVVIGRKAKYNSANYRILKNGPGLTTDELLLLCDGGNLCFGGKVNSSTSLTVWED